jgi:type VI protein secretion system component Hcp
MKLGISAVTTGLFALAVAAPFSALAQNTYLFWPNVQGTVTVPRLVPAVISLPPTLQAIPLKTYAQSFAIDNPNIVQIGKAGCGNIRFTKSADSSSASFLVNAVQNSAIPKMTVAYTVPGVVAGTLYLPVVIVLLNAYVAEVDQVEDTSAANGAKLNDSVVLTASTIEVTYYGAQLASGLPGPATKFGWNCQTSTPVTF